MGRGSAAAPAPPWTPLQFTGKRLILDPSSLASGAVTTWADQSGLANDATQGTALLRPTKTASWVNGQPSVTFDGTTFLEGAANLAATAGAAFTVLLVGQIPTFGPDLSGGAFLSLRKTTRYTSVAHFLSAGTHYVSGNGLDAGANVTLVTPIAASIAAPFHETMIFHGNGFVPNVEVNGLPRAIGAGAQVTQDGTAGYLVGTNGTQFIIGHIGYMAVLDHEVTVPEIALWEGYVFSKWGLASS